VVVRAGTNDSVENRDQFPGENWRICLAREARAAIEYTETESIDSSHRVDFSTSGMNQLFSGYA